MKRKDLTAGALSAPLPPCIVTVGDMEKCNMLTVAWTGILSTVPPRTYISVRPSRYSYGMLGVGKDFVINLPPAALAKEVDFVGIYTGAKMNKFEKSGLTPIKSKTVSAPTVAECPIALECRVFEVLKMGSHDVFMADILSVSCKEELLDADGKIHFEKADLLAYAHGEYYRLGDRVGRFGFSTDKPKKAAGGSDFKKSAEAKKSSAAKTEAKRTSEAEKKEPFYKTAPKTAPRKKNTLQNKDKGRPHGKKAKGERG